MGSWLARCGALIAAALAGFATPAQAADPMSFRLVTITSSTACRAHCKRPIDAEVIAATGEINNSTSDDFLAFLTEHAQDGQLRPVILIHSPGGTVVGAMQLGTMFRKLGAAVIVARAADDPDGEHAHVVPGACMSACVYAFFGGAKRVVPTVSRLGIHRMAIYGSEHDPAGGTAATRSFGTGDIVTALASYTRMMGIDPAVISYAETIDPNSIHIVTPREIAHWRMGSPRL
ncbi:MAG TPA: hypothetical protein VH414_16145 [Lichenihabitans sp.]|jgi:hypothetical protein|nr:hypothetical protein [Lichenihabitans sp.]